MVEAGKAQAETVCSSCGSPIGAQAAFCDWCGSPMPQTVTTPPLVKTPPSLWRRVITGGIAISFLVLAGLFFFGAATLNDAGDEWTFVTADFLLIAGGAFTLVGLPFAIATVFPFGPTRRLLVGAGAGLVGLGFVWAISRFAEPAGLDFAFPSNFEVGIVAAFAYFGYRIAR